MDIVFELFGSKNSRDEKKAKFHEVLQIYFNPPAQKTQGLVQDIM